MPLGFSQNNVCAADVCAVYFLIERTLHINLGYYQSATVAFHFGGCGGSLVDSTPFVLKGRGFESRSSLHAGTLGKSFTRSCLWRFGVKLRRSIRAVSEAPSGLVEAL